MAKKVVFQRKQNIMKNNLLVISNIISIYNKCLNKYTDNYKTRLPMIATNTDNIPKKYININEYIHSKPIWKQINTFVDKSGVDNVGDYIDVLLRNWNNIAVTFNNDKLMGKPLANVIFSTKTVYLYEHFKKIETNREELTNHLNINNTDDFYNLTPTLQGNINSLFRLKNINSDMTYKDIVSIFSAEFDEQFISLINRLDENEINENKVLSELKMMGLKVD